MPAVSIARSNASTAWLGQDWSCNAIYAGKHKYNEISQSFISVICSVKPINDKTLQQQNCQ